MLLKSNLNKLYIALFSTLLALSVPFHGMYEVNQQFVFILLTALLFGAFCITTELDIRPKCLMDWFVIAAVGVYVICSFDAVSVWDSLMCLLRYLCCYMLYMLVKNTVAGNHGLLYAVIYFLSSGASLLGLMQGIGALPVSGAYDSARGLLLSVFNYHNASAVFFACMFVMGMYLFRNSRSKIMSVAIGVCNSCLLSSVVYSQSRGTWLVFAVSVIVYLILDRKSPDFSKNILLLLASGISVAAVMSPFADAFRNRARNGESAEITLCLGLIAISFIISGIISYFADSKKLNSIFSGKNLLIALPIVTVVAVVAVFVLMPEAIVDRISEFSLSSDTVSERTVFFRDAVRIFREHPINGIGGDGWQYVYPSVQTNFYTVGHPHSFLAEMFTDAGIFGVALYVFMLAAFVVCFVRQRKNKTVLPALISVLIILLHSFFDFETDYFTILAFLFTMFAVIAPENTAEPKKRSFMVAVPVVMAVWALVNIFAYFNYQTAIDMANSGGEISAVYEHTLATTRYMPIRTDYLTTHGNVCLGMANSSEKYLDEAETVFRKSHELNKYNYETITSLAIVYVKKGEYEKAGEYVKLLAELQPFINTTYQRTSDVYDVMINYGTQTNDYDCIRYACNMLIDTVNRAYKISEENDARIEIFWSVRDNIAKAKEILDVLNEAGV